MAKRKNRRVAVIMAGGSGERFWPLSRGKHPKQLLKLTSETETLLEEAVNRILPLVKAGNVYVATSRKLAPAIAKANLAIPRENILAEPMRRNTTGCLCWVAAELAARFPGEDPVIAILTADHMIGEKAKFRARVKVALDVAEQHDSLVTIGIRPTRPETGYGYIETKRMRRGNSEAVEVVRFREKPSTEQAEEFLASGCYSWNSGMFFWKLSTFLREMSAASPAAGDVTKRMAALLEDGKPRAAAALFAQIPDISIDYSLLEKSTTVMMVEANFPWDDVGSWDALERSRAFDKNGNVTSGDPILVDSRNCIVLNESTKNRIALGVVGLEDIVVIVSDDSVLVVPKDKAQEVRFVARELKKRGAKQV